ncbi:hypothetical protein QVD17_16507 [Tagetes erecta]|uniref:Alanine racemase N-terminal domain-containing protein n=1 Tax=Tagetes erecta TaxID=13708 RepID=A0AAD8KWY0_TARER|nr:hypothetical protein QVD17_16507 [Tagetes erecta]
MIVNNLDRVIGNIGRKPLKVLVRAAKFGVDPDGYLGLVKHVTSNCPNLEFCGLMTIGMPDYTLTPENFKTLASCRTEIEMGSTNVRIGSTIFGAREYPKNNE